jgi:hypothetical protein
MSSAGMKKDQEGGFAYLDWDFYLTSYSCLSVVELDGSQVRRFEVTFRWEVAERHQRPLIHHKQSKQIDTNDKNETSLVGNFLDRRQ